MKTDKMKKIFAEASKELSSLIDENKKRGYIILVANEDGYMDIDIRGRLSIIAPALACSMQKDGIRNIIFRALVLHFRFREETIRDFIDVIKGEVQELNKVLQQLKEQE